MDEVRDEKRSGGRLKKIRESKMLGGGSPGGIEANR